MLCPVPVGLVGEAAIVPQVRVLILPGAAGVSAGVGVQEAGWLLPLVSTVSMDAHSPPCVCHFILIPLPETSSNQVSPSAARALFGRGGSWSMAPSHKPCGRPAGRQTWGCCHPDPCTHPRDLIVLRHSPYRLIFQCPLQFLISNLHICWGTVGCSLCSSEDQLGVPPVCRGKWTPLPPISLPPS